MSTDPAPLESSIMTEEMLPKFIQLLLDDVASQDSIRFALSLIDMMLEDFSDYESKYIYTRAINGGSVGIFKQENMTRVTDPILAHGTRWMIYLGDVEIEWDDHMDVPQNHVLLLSKDQCKRIIRVLETYKKVIEL